MRLQITSIFVLLLMGTAFSAPKEDLIVDLPGLNYEINFQQYSGYLNGTPGRKLHYWFVESQNSPKDDPLFLWLNGGPGCSSVMGLLTELGPFRIDDDGETLIDNPYSWNKIANIVFLESPACVGFSYDENNNCATGDDEVAEANYLALQDFFAKFPEYLDHDFYVSGESYAGIYVPTLSVKIVEGQNKFPIKFTGYAVGNGLLSYKNNDNSLMFYGYYHSLFGQNLWDEMIQYCCENGVESKETCDFSNSVSPKCQSAVLKGTQIIYYGGINHYNLYGTCDVAGDGRYYRTEYTAAIENVFRKIRKQSPVYPEPYSDPPCLDYSDMRHYLNRDVVRSALHIPDVVQTWDICSDEVAVSYNREYDSMSEQLKTLRDNKIRGLIYSGNTDLACNFLGNIWDIDTLGSKRVSDRKQWTADNDVAGYYVKYEYLDFVTVRGSGHMVPQYRPIQGLQMITSFVNNEPY